MPIEVPQVTIVAHPIFAKGAPGFRVTVYCQTGNDWGDSYENFEVTYDAFHADYVGEITAIALAEVAVLEATRMAKRKWREKMGEITPREHEAEEPSKDEPMPGGDAARIHRYCRGQVAIAREEGEAQVRFCVGDIRNDLCLNYADAALDICQVLDTRKFWEQADVNLLSKRGPVAGLDTVYRFLVR